MSKVVEQLTSEKLQALKIINTILKGNFQVGGSLSLIHYSIIDRPSHDIDIVVKSDKDFELLVSSLELLHNLKYLTFKPSEDADYNDDDQNENLGLLYRFLINNIYCCAFVAENEKFQEISVLIDEKESISLKISEPKYAIQAKNKYVINLLQKDKLTESEVERLTKHILDIIKYQSKHIISNKLGDIFFTELEKQLL